MNLQPQLFGPDEPLVAPVLTPVEKTDAGVVVKRDDLYDAYRAPGGKARTCLRIATEHPGKALVTAGSRGSPQVHIVALVANGLGVPCRVHVPAAKESYPELEAARELGAEVIEHRPGHNSVIKARARQDAEATGAAHIPFGMECHQAVQETAAQCANIPADCGQVVVPVGSGMSLAGILVGLWQLRRPWFPRVLGVTVGARPHKRLDKYAPGWQRYCTLVPPAHGYQQPARATDFWGIELDPYYEAKAAPYARPGDLFWVVGIRPRLGRWHG